MSSEYYLMRTPIPDHNFMVVLPGGKTFLWFSNMATAVRSAYYHHSSRVDENGVLRPSNTQDSDVVIVQHTPTSVYEWRWQDVKRDHK